MPRTPERRPKSLMAGGRNVDSADAAEHRLHVADAGRAAIETARAAAKPCEQVEVADFSQVQASSRDDHWVSPCFWNTPSHRRPTWRGKGVAGAAGRAAKRDPCGVRSGRR